MTILPIACFLFASSPIPSQEGLNLEVPEGLQVHIWAESPLLYNPTAMDVDGQGRLYVTEAVNYRKWNGRNKGREHPEGDRVMILRDTDGDGTADKSVVFAQGPELVAPLGVLALGNGRVLVSCSPSAILYVDEDGDDVADRHEVFLTGFGGKDHDHGLHSFIHGPEGALYVAAGNAGPHMVTDAAGWSLRSARGTKSDDNKVWVGGLALRVGTDGRGLSVMAHNFRNNYEIALDSFGNIFVSDNDDDGNRSCRTLWTMEGGNYGFFSADGKRSWRADKRDGQPIPSAHWHQEDPGVAPAGTINGAGGPTGVCVYEGEPLAAWIDGAVLNADAGAGVVYAHSPRMDGAGYTLDGGWLIRGARNSGSRSADWFRPSDVCVAEDGTVFVADWYDPGVGGHAAGDQEAYGRILQITHKDGSIKKPATQGLSQEWEPFFSPAPSARALWCDALGERGKELNLALIAALAEPISARKKSRILFQLSKSGTEHAAILKRFLKDPSPELRISALRALRHSGVSLLPLFASLVGDKSPGVRREVMLILQHNQDAAGYADWMVELARGYNGIDRNYLEAFGLAAAGHEELVFASIAAELGDTPSRWDARFAGLAWRLHPTSAVPQFVARASDVALAQASRIQALDALAFMKAGSAAEAMATLSLTTSGDVSKRAAYWLKTRDSNDWSKYDIARRLQVGNFANAELLWKSEVIRKGKHEVKVDITGSKRLWLVVGDGGDGNDNDWGNWIEPSISTAEGSLRLTDVGWVQASSQWGEVNKSKNAKGAPLRVAGEEFPWGIGTHAKSSIEFLLPAGATSFHAWVGPDDAGLNTSRTSLEFSVYAERPRDRTALLQNERILADGTRNEAEREAAIRALAVHPEGGLMLIRAARAGKVPKALQAIAAELIFTNPDISIRALASEVFERPGEEAAALPSVTEILALKGDAANGRRLFQDPEMLCSTCHSFDGIGREIGPDLTAIRSKYGRQELLDSILNPSAGIAFGYESWVFEVEGQGWLSGFVLAEGENIVLKDSAGYRHVIASEDVLSRDLQKVSVMPTGVALGLGAQGLADLLTFLLEDTNAEPIFGETEVLFDGSSLDGWGFHLSDANKTRDDVWSIEEGEYLRCKGRPSGYIFTEKEYQDFELELEWRFDPKLGAGNSGVLLRVVGRDKVWPKSIEAQLQSGSAGDIWNIDGVVMLVDESRTNGRRTQKLQPSTEKPLGEWNAYRIRLDGGNLQLFVNGVLQNEARWCAEVAGRIALQSEGAEIHFRNVRIRPVIGHTSR